MARAAQAVLASALVVLLAFPQVSDPAPADARGPCMTAEHRTIKVFMIHRRGSSRPAYVRTVAFHLYVETVMASGAWPGSKPMESLKVGAVAIKQFAAWHICHRTRGYVWRGVRYDIKQGDQYFMPSRAHRINAKIRKAVHSTWDTWVMKGGRLFRPGWRGNAGRDGWHLYEDSITRLAKRGWGHHRIIRQQLSPVRIVYR